MRNQTISAFDAKTPVVQSIKTVATTIYEDGLSGLEERISHACSDQASLTPHAVRQALDDALNGNGATELAKRILQMPRSLQTYTRHILYSDPKGRFTIVALVWGTNQASPVHAHFTWCAYKVLSGVLSESHFEWDRTTEKARRSGQVQRPAGQSVCGHAGLELIHQLGNEQEQPAVSIHVYGMDSERIGTHVNRLLVSANHA